MFQVNCDCDCDFVLFFLFTLTIFLSFFFGGYFVHTLAHDIEGDFAFFYPSLRLAVCLYGFMERVSYNIAFLTEKKGH